MFSSLLTASLFGLSLAFPSDLPPSQLFPRDACSGNTATTRTEWCDYSIDTDYTTVVPDTGVTREYWFDVTDTTVAPDGYSRYAMTVNGTIPGPTIFADWGDTVVVHVTNSLTESTNGTSFHFHGIRQNYTVGNDGVSSITQCPTPPGSSITYTWRAVQYGTTWYHSHFGVQAWNGVFGGIVINGPATADYEEDLGILFLNDWSHQTADQKFYTSERTGPPELDNALINGTNVYGDDDSADQTGSRFTLAVTEGTSYRLRIVNGAADSFFKFSIDNHTFTVIAMDLVPVVPFTTDIISLGEGQRYDVIFTADQSAVADSFWMRAIPQSSCSDNESADNIKGIVYYGDSATTPTTTAYDYTDSCADIDSSLLVPYLAMTVDSPTWTITENAQVIDTDGLLLWYFNDTTLSVEWEEPTLLEVYEGQTTFNASQNVVQLSEADEWAYMVIETSFAAYHPIHLHGHDFFVLAQDTGTFSSNVTLNLDNPPRRDTVMLFDHGYVVIAWKTDNPGTWLMHCHIAWHQAEGLALQFVERYSEISASALSDDDAASLQDNCAAWDTWQTDNGLVIDDSGI